MYRQLSYIIMFLSSTILQVHTAATCTDASPPCCTAYGDNCHRFICSVPQRTENLKMPLERFVGKVGLMSGCTEGIGLATAKRIGLEGCKVVVSSRKEHNVQNAVDILRCEGIEASGITCHQGKKEDRQRLIEYTLEKYGGFDHVFISAGVSPHVGNLLDVTEDKFDKTFDVNVKGNFMFIQECVPHLERRGGGSIVTNSTAAASDPGFCITGRDTRLYLLSKFTLSALTYHVSRECWGKKIRINSVLPGTIATKFLKGGVSNDMLLKHLTMFDMPYNDVVARIGNPDEIASVVSFLLSDDASYISGECITCVGGMGTSRYC